jgi:DNA primase
MDTLNKLGISITDSTPNHKGWIKIQCPNPSHNEKEFDNCAININNSVCKCFSCQYKTNLIGIVKDNRHCNFKEALEFIQGGVYSAPPVKEQTKPVKERRRVQTKVDYDFTHVELDPSKYYYTQQRRISKEFCKAFNVRHALSGRVEEYYILPIIDTKKRINEYEARKLKEYEVLNTYLDTKGCEYSIIKQNFKELCTKQKVKYNKGIITINGVESSDFNLRYLLKPKTIYAMNSRCQETLWNIDNLDINKPLYAVEGCASVPRIWTSLSKNVTSIFGVSITEAQLDYLRMFKEVIYIPDPDEAGYRSVEFLFKNNMSNIKVAYVESEDTDESYIKDIELSKKYLLEEFIKKFGLTFRVK